MASSVLDIVRRSRWQPGPNAVVDWSNPVTRGLLCAYLPGAAGNGSGPLRDLVGGTWISGAGTPAPRITAMGRGISYPNSLSDYHDQIIGSSHRIATQPPVSIMWAGEHLSGLTASPGAHLFGLDYAQGGGTPPFFACSLGTNNTNARFEWNDGSSARTLDAGAFTKGVFTVYVAVHNGSTVTLYMSGAAPVSTSSVTASIAYSATTDIMFGFVAARQNAAASTLGAIWKRALNAQEANALLAEPYSFFTTPLRIALTPPTPAAGTTQALAGTITGTSTMSGTTLSMTYPLAGTIAATSAISGTTPTMVYGLAGSLAGTSTLSGTTLRMTYALSGSLAGTSSLTGNLSLNGAVTADPNALKFTYREHGHTMTYRERA